MNQIILNFLLLIVVLLISVMFFKGFWRGVIGKTLGLGFNIENIFFGNTSEDILKKSDRASGVFCLLMAFLIFVDTLIVTIFNIRSIDFAPLFAICAALLSWPIKMYYLFRNS